jgi:hypothetical protein
MPGLILDRIAEVWRFSAVSGFGQHQTETLAIPRMQCAIIPVSSLAAEVTYGYEATHIIWVAHWLTLRREDEVRWGRREGDAFGDMEMIRYTIRGSRLFKLGGTQRAFYSKEQH